MIVPPAAPRNDSAYVILVVNPGSTSTKVAVFEDERPAHQTTVRHSADDLASFAHIVDQAETRLGAVRGSLDGFGVAPAQLDAVAARGGLLTPIESGTCRVGPAMLDDLRRARHGEHASNLGAIIAAAVAAEADCPAFICDPVVVDELCDEARFSGIPDIRRRSIWHALNQKAVARVAAEALGKRYAEANLIVVHLGGGTSVAAHRRGRAIDVNNALDGDGPFAVERSGGLPAADLARLAWRTPRDELLRKIAGRGGVVAYLGTNDLIAVEQRITAGDAAARAVLDAMAYQVAKEIGACAAVLCGEVDAVVLTGALARCEALVAAIRRRVDFIAPMQVLPGEREMEALALGALRVLRGEETARAYSPDGPPPADRQPQCFTASR
jgi:butyrate kinase